MTREKALQWGVLRGEKIADAADERGVYQIYYEFECGSTACARTRCWRSTAARPRKCCGCGWRSQERDWRAAIDAVFQPDQRSPLAEQLELAIARRGRAPAAAGHRARCAPRADRKGRSARHRRVCRQPARAAQPAAAGRADRAGHRPRLPHRLQGGGGRPDRQGAGYRHHLSARAAERVGRSPEDAGRRWSNGSQRHPDLHRQRHRLARDRAAGGRADPQTRRRTCNT